MSNAVGRAVGSATIVTPCLNAEASIARTAESIMAQTAVQSGRLKLQYLVCDGASSDRTLDIVREICGDHVEILSAKDHGMYEAMANGLRKATGDVVGCLDAGDTYAPGALDVVADVFEQHPRVDWLMGLHVVCNEEGQITYVRIPFRCRRRLLRKALLYKIVRFGVQQESTFWRRDLHSIVDLDVLATFRLAGDAYLWQSFAERTEPVIVESYLGGWMRHEGQLSSDLAAYLRELDPYRGRATVLDYASAYFDASEGLLPPKVRKWLNPHRFLRFSPERKRWM